MRDALSVGRREHCGASFGYVLIHNGFNNSAFAYCDSCTCTALLDGEFSSIPKEAGFRPYGPIMLASEKWLTPCGCGGSFRADASPRCPQCNSELSAEAASVWIEANASGTAKGWRWQGSWFGVYAIVIEGRAVKNNWREYPA